MPIYSSTLASSGGSNVLSIQTIISDKTLSTWEAYNFYPVDSTANNITVTLPASTPTNIGRSICIKKINNSNNFVKIVASGTDLLEGTLGGAIYLYNKGDSVTLCSVNGDSKIINDSRNSVGSSMSYLKAYTQLNVSQSIGLNANIVFPAVEATQGSNISYDYTTGIVTLTPNVTYRLRGFLGYVNYSAQEGYGVLQFYNITTNQPVGCQATLVNVNRNINESKTPMAEYTFTPNVQTQMALRLVSGTTGLSTIQGNWLEVEEISRQATVINVLDYASLLKSTSTSAAGATDIIFDKYTGNMVYDPSTGLLTLAAGKTYLIQAGMRQTASGMASDYKVCDTSNNPINANAIGAANANTSQGDNIISFYHNPPLNTQIKLRNTAGSGTLGSGQQWMTVTQVGSSAVSNVPLSMVSGITDNSSSGYFDIGNMRFQWGSSPSGTAGLVTINFPAPFGNTNYSYSSTGIIVSGSTNVNTVLSTSISERQTTYMKVYKPYANAGVNGQAGEGFTWIAIGIKP